METKTYYVQNTKGQGTFNKIFMYLDWNTIKFIDSTPSQINGDLSQKNISRCILILSSIKLEIPNNDENINHNTQILIKTNSKYLDGYLWKIEDKIFTTNSINYSFTKSGIHII